MNDLLAGARYALTDFGVLAAVGGFSYADVPESAKGWAATILFNDMLKSSLKHSFPAAGHLYLRHLQRLPAVRADRLGALAGIEPEHQPRFVRNISARFESRWTTVKVSKSPAMMLEGMEGSGFWHSC